MVAIVVALKVPMSMRDPESLLTALATHHAEAMEDLVD